MKLIPMVLKLDEDINKYLNAFEQINALFLCFGYELCINKIVHF